MKKNTHTARLHAATIQCPCSIKKNHYHVACDFHTGFTIKYILTKLIPRCRDSGTRKCNCTLCAMGGLLAHKSHPSGTITHRWTRVNNNYALQLAKISASIQPYTTEALGFHHFDLMIDILKNSNDSINLILLKIYFHNKNDKYTPSTHMNSKKYWLKLFAHVLCPFAKLVFPCHNIRCKSTARQAVELVYCKQHQASG